MQVPGNNARRFGVVRRPQREDRARKFHWLPDGSGSSAADLVQLEAIGLRPIAHAGNENVLGGVAVCCHKNDVVAPAPKRGGLRVAYVVEV